MKIVVVDDSGVQRKMIINIIRKAGFDNEILEADTGKTAIQIVGMQYKDIGLILCDWNMPVMNGYEFIAGMAKVPQVASIPIVMVTTEGTEAKIEQAYTAHPSLAGYITKPFTPDQLREKIEPIIKRAQADTPPPPPPPPPQA